MHLYRYLEEISDNQKGSVLALGNFDGFHKGHIVVVGEAGRIAKKQVRPLGVLTTEPHPRSFFNPSQPNYRLTPFRERSRFLEEFGVDIHFVPHFDYDFSSTLAEDFIQKILVNQIGVSHIVTGYDYKFGKGRSGDTDLLKSFGKKLGFDVTIIAPVCVGVEGAAGEIYSSTLIRDSLRAGLPRKAAALLGHWWVVNGRVVEGDKRGRTIGFPTANIEFHDSIIPHHGVYAIRAIFENSGKVIDGIANVGTRPTFDKKGELLEVHLFDFSKDCYNEHVQINFVGFIRSEKKFEGIEQLRSQIKIDCTTAKGLLRDPENDHSRLSAITLVDYLIKYPIPFS
ncbi:MAG: bifunctional riboflavin kinase/FAD synthetase [Sphingomonadales bacterium]|jgi:riboflavin kinase/FMN adenylyltransferase